MPGRKRSNVPLYVRIAETFTRQVATGVLRPGDRVPTATVDLIHTGREARLDPGEGGIDLAAIVNRIPQVPYSLEIPNLERVKAVGYEEHARLCCANARKYLAAHPRPDRVTAER